MDFDVVGFVLGPDLFELAGKRVVVQRFAVVRCDVLKRQQYDAGFEIGGYEPTYFARPINVLPNLIKTLGRTIVIVRYDWPTIETLLSHADPTGCRSPQGLHV
ncbi:hypothetical protein D3C76_708180 [compost metagenome]